MANNGIEWIGKRVRLSAGLRDSAGDPHLQAGKEGTVLSQAENGALVVDCDGSHAVVKPGDLVDAAAGPASEGIHPTSSMIKRVKVRDIQASPFNPRQHYPEREMQELADSIRAVGIMQPVLLRPIMLPLGEGTSDEQLSHYELVFGHRRFRGAQLAGLADVPAMVRKLDDQASAQLQAVENLQRENLDAIEEAQGFAAYIAAHGISKDELAKHLGISRTLVYNRLKLATLGKAAAQAYREQKIGAEVATLIARVPGEANQAKALATALETESGYGAKRSFRTIRENLAEKFATGLKDAKWDLADETLLPLAGACTTCPKRSGSTPELYGDFVKPPGDRNHWSQVPKGENVCTDIDCFGAKKTAHLKLEQIALEAKGKIVIAGAKARAAIDAQGNVKGAYIALKDAKDELQKARTAAQAKATIVPPQVFIVQDPRTGKTVEVLKREELKAAGVKMKEKPKQSSWQEQQKQREAAYEKERVVRRSALATHMRIFEASRDAAAGASLDVWWLQRVALLAFGGMGHWSRTVLAEHYGHQSREELSKRIGSMPEAHLRTLLLDCVMLDGVHAEHGASPENLLAAAKHVGVNVGALLSATLAEPTAQGVKPSAAKAAKASKAGAATPATVATAKGKVKQSAAGAEAVAAATAAAAADDGKPWPFPGAQPGSPAAAHNEAASEVQE